MIRLELQDPLQKPAAKHDNATHGARAILYCTGYRSWDSR